MFVTTVCNFPREATRHGPPHRAFSLLELLIVIGVIAVLVSLMLPVLSRIHELNRRAVCLSNLRQLGLAARSYALANNDLYPVRPPTADWPPQVVWAPGCADTRGLWAGYLPGYTVAHSSPAFFCPSNEAAELLHSYGQGWSVMLPGIYVIGYAYFGAYNYPNNWVAKAPPAKRLGDSSDTPLFGDVTESYLYTNGEPWFYAAHTIHGGAQWTAQKSPIVPEGMNCVLTDGSARWFSYAQDTAGHLTATSECEFCVQVSNPGFLWGKPAPRSK